ncbi:MAG: hypothetical protein GEU28_10185 [Dehalococcoidia bacterium]|nr:hypothetical protein [Dehalococcoidia bacterium]
MDRRAFAASVIARHGLAPGIGAVLLAAVMVTVAACGDDDDQPNGGTPEVESTRVAGPATLEVTAGGREGVVEIRAFMPADITVMVGDTVTWDAPADAHTVTFLQGGEPSPLIVPDPTSPDDVVLNPAVVEPVPAMRPLAFDGSFALSSGMFGAGMADPPRVMFTTPGSYAYLCLVHPRMQGEVSVVEDADSAVTQGELDAESAVLRAQYVEEGEAALLAAQEGGPERAVGPDESSVVRVLAGLSTDHTDVRAFVPEQLKIEEGDTVVWENAAAEPHTITFGEPPPFLVEEQRADGTRRLVISAEMLNVALGAFEFVAGEFFHSGLLVENGPLGIQFRLLFPSTGSFAYVDSLYPDQMTGEIAVGE